MPPAASGAPRPAPRRPQQPTASARSAPRRSRSTPDRRPGAGNGRDPRDRAPPSAAGAPEPTRARHRRPRSRASRRRRRASAAGAARRFASGVTTGTDPNVASRTGVTPTWAASETASGSRNHAGPGSRARIGAENAAIPALAPHDSRNATECSRNGSTTSNAITAKRDARARSTRAGRRTTSRARRPPAPIARSTEGSNRVIVANISTIATRDDRAGTRARAGAASGPNNASVNATFSPETASRCESPSRGTPRRRRRARRGCRRAGTRPAARASSAPAAWCPRNTTARSEFGEAHRAARRGERQHLGSVQAADRVPPARAIVEARRVQRPEPAAEHDAVARLEHAQRGARRRRTQPRTGCGDRRRVGTRTNASVSKRPLCGSSTSTPDDRHAVPRAGSTRGRAASAPSRRARVASAHRRSTPSAQHGYREPRPARPGTTRRRARPRPRSAPRSPDAGPRARPAKIPRSTRRLRPPRRIHSSALTHRAAPAPTATKSRSCARRPVADAVHRA